MVIAFDLDDTLYFEHDFLESGLKAVAHELQRQGILESHEAVRILHSKPTPAECIDALVDVINHLHGEGYITVAEILRIYRSHFPSIALRDGTVTLLRELQRLRIRIALITDGRSETQRNKIRALGLDDYVNPDFIIISEETGADKASPLPFERLAALCPEEDSFVYIGDNPAKDFHWPNEMGWTTIQIDNQEGAAIHPQTPSPLQKYNAKYHIRHLSELLGIIAG